MGLKVWYQSFKRVAPVQAPRQENHRLTKTLQGYLRCFNIGGLGIVVEEAALVFRHELQTVPHPRKGRQNLNNCLVGDPAELRCGNGG